MSGAPAGRETRALARLAVGLCVLAVVLAPVSGTTAVGGGSQATVAAADRGGSAVGAAVSPLDDGNNTRGPNATVPATAVTLDAASATVAEGGTGTVDVVVDAATDDRVGSYDLTVETSDPETLEITGYTVPTEGFADATLRNVSVADDGSSVTVSVVSAEPMPGDAVGSIGTLEVEGSSTGTASLSVSVAAIGNRTGHPYEVAVESGTALTVGDPETGSIDCSESSLSNDQVSVSLADGGRAYVDGLSDADPSRAPNFGDAGSFAALFYPEGGDEAYRSATTESTTLFDSQRVAGRAACTYRVTRSLSAAGGPDLTYVTETQLRNDSRVPVVNVTVDNEGEESVTLDLPNEAAPDRPETNGSRLLTLGTRGTGSPTRLFASGADRAHSLTGAFPAEQFAFGAGSPPFVTVYSASSGLTAGVLDGASGPQTVAAEPAPSTAGVVGATVDVGEVTLEAGEAASWTVAVAPHDGGPTRGQRVVSDVAYDFGDFSEGPLRLTVDQDDGEGDYSAIAPAVENATDRTTVEVRPGTYEESVTITDDLRLVAPEGATLDGSALSEGASAITVGEGAAPAVDGFEITGYDTAVDASGTDDAWSVSGATLSDNRVGVDATRSTGNWTVSGSTVEANTDGVLATDTVGAWSVTESSLVDNDGRAVDASGADPAGDASYNWWGSEDGPGGEFNGTGDAAVGNVTVEPFYGDAARTLVVEFEDVPAPSFTVSPDAPNATETVTFDASPSETATPVETYNWTFGDGNATVTDEASVTHTYDVPDDYRVTLEITDGQGLTNHTTREVTVGSGTDAASPPTPTISLTPAEPTTDDTVEVDASGSSDNGTIESYEWTFGDGGTATGATASHTYDEAGRYEVELVVTDDDGNTNATDRVVGVSSATESGVAPPDATVTVEPETPTVSEPVTVDASGSTTDDGDIESYEWSFGDGIEAGGASATHTYSVAGSYMVTLNVTNSFGKSALVTREVTVEPAEPGAPDPEIVVTPAAPDPGEEVTFDASGSSDDGTVTGYEWTFGDGETATGEQVTHSYAANGSYTVRLTVTDDDGTTATATTSVGVGSGAGAGAGDDSGSSGSGSGSGSGADEEGPIRHDPATPDPGQQVTIEAVPPTDESAITAYDWRFGDGEGGAGQSVTHAYADNGTYTIELEITYDSGFSDTLTDTIAVGDAGGGSGSTIVVEQGSTRFTVEPISSSQSVSEFYGHNENGEFSANFPSSIALGGATTFVYDGSDGLSLVHVLGPGSGSATFGFSGVGGWRVQDDSAQGPTDSYSGTSEVEWSWSSGRTDGGALGVSPGSTVTVTPTSFSGSWTMVSAGTSDDRSLSSSEPVTIVLDPEGSGDGDGDGDGDGTGDVPDGAVYGADSPAADYDADGDGTIAVTEVGAAAADYVAGTLSITELGQISAAYARSG